MTMLNVMFSVDIVQSDTWVPSTSILYHENAGSYVPSKALVPTHQTKECHNPENHTMSLHHCETMKSYMSNTVHFLQSLPYL